MSPDLPASGYGAGITAEAAQGLADQIPPAAEPLVLDNAVLVDAAQGPRGPAAIVIADGVITEIAPAGAAAAPVRAQHVDVGGRFVIPGLWDMHVHQFDARYLPFHLINGVTGIRHMGGIPAHRQWRDDMKAGQLTGPRTVLASSIIDGPQPMRPGSIAVHDAAGARQAVLDSRKAGADFLKIYNLVPRDAYAALVREARRQQIPVVGHLPLSVSLAQAAANGQAGVEHLEGQLISGARDAERLQAELAALTVTSLADMHQVQQRTLEAARHQDSARADEICTELAVQGTWVTPTLAVHHATATAGSDDFPLTDLLRHVEPYVRPIWDQALAAEVPEQMRKQQRELFEAHLDAVGRLHRHGVGLLAGTDTFVPGYSLHDELELLVRAGLPPLEALSTATYNPAAFFGVTETFGTVEQGRVADLVILGSDPLENIRHTRDIIGVVLAGRAFDPSGLDNLTAQTIGNTSQH